MIGELYKGNMLNKNSITNPILYDYQQSTKIITKTSLRVILGNDRQGPELRKAPATCVNETLKRTVTEFVKTSH